MKTKFLCYSSSEPNQVVWHYAELEKICDGVYTYLKSKDKYREQDDLIAIVLELENVFFEHLTFCRRHLAGQNIAEAGTKMLATFHSFVKQTMREGTHLPLLFVRIYEEMGRDSTPLIRYREERQLRLKQEEEEKNRREEEVQRRVEERNREGLRKLGEEFIAGEFISCEDFIDLCRFEQIPIPLRTLGTLRRNVKELSRIRIGYTHTTGKSGPKLNGCIALAKALRRKLTAK